MKTLTKFVQKYRLLPKYQIFFPNADMRYRLLLTWLKQFFTANNMPRD